MIIDADRFSSLCILYKQVPASFTLSSSSEEVISLIAEVVCISALQSTERHFLDNSLGRTSSNFFQWFKKHRRIVSKDSSIFIYQLFEDEIIGNGKSLLENFNSLKGTFWPKVKPKSHWWKPSAYFQLESIGGSEFASWLIEYIPAYRLEIDTNRLKNVKFEGWRKSAENLWEVLLTHSQMVFCSLPFFIGAFSFIVVTCFLHMKNPFIINCPCKMRVCWFKCFCN